MLRFPSLANLGHPEGPDASTAQGSSTIRCLLPLAGAAGNFLCPASALSSNAFKTVMDIDTLGTFNVSRVLYEKFFHVSVPRPGPPRFWPLLTAPLVCCRTMEG